MFTSDIDDANSGTTLQELLPYSREFKNLKAWLLNQTAWAWILHVPPTSCHTLGKLLKFLSKNYEGSEILPYFQANKLTCPSFMGHGNDFIAHNNSRSQSVNIFLHWFPKHHFPKRDVERVRWHLEIKRVALQERNPELRES